MSTFHHQEEKRGLVRAEAENRGRHVILNASFETTGSGEIANESPFVFGLKMIEMPNVSYSYYVDEDVLEEGVWPRCWGGISEWRIDPDGFYTQAYGFVIVDATPMFAASYAAAGSPDVPNYTIKHFFTFSGVGIKFGMPDGVSLDSMND